MKSQLSNLFLGASGITLNEVVEVLPPISPDEIGTIGNLIIQVAIAIATIFGIFRRKKKS